MRDGALVPMRTLLPRGWLMALLVAILATGTYWYATGMRLGPLSAPMSYDGDALQYGYIIESFSRSGGLSHIDNAGAPFGTQNVDFPNGDFSNMAIAAVLFSGGYGFGFNLFLLLSVALTAVAGFAISRRCGLAMAPSFLVALAFALLPFHFQRIGHLFYTNYTTAAVALWLALRLAEPLFDRAQPTKRRWLGLAWVALACLWCGTTGVYYAFFSCIALSIAAIVQSAHAGTLRPAIRASAILAGIVLCVGVQLLPTRVHNQSEGPNTSVGNRSLVESEIYGLKLSQLLLPVPGHRIPALAKARAKYDAESLSNNENQTATLGALGSAGFMMGMLILFVPSVRRQFSLPLQLCAVLLIALFMYSTIGGVGSLFALFVSPQIRALNRISPFIALFSLIIAGGTLQLIWTRVREWHPMLPRWGGVLVAGLAVFILADQVSPGFGQSREQRLAVTEHYKDDRLFAEKLAAQLPAGTRVMQLPYIAYPEMPELLGSYAQFRNNLHAPTLHWSHGAMRSRPESNWLSEVSTLPIDHFVDVAKALGFSALVFDQRVASPRMAEIQQRYSEVTGATQFSDNGGTQTAVVSARLLKATARAAILDTGWHITEGDDQHRWTWSMDRPTFAFSPADAGMGDCTLSVSLSSIRPTTIKVVDPQGHVFANANLKPDAVSTLELTIPAETHRIVLENDAPAAPAGNGDPRDIAIRWDRTIDQLPLCRYQATAKR